MAATGRQCGILSGQALQFDIDQPPELAAGLRGFTDRITVIVESGDPGGVPGEFEAHMKQALVEWYDGAKVTEVQ